VIMVGEIRDAETAHMRSSRIDGHLVLTTLHTRPRGGGAAADRFGIEGFLLRSTLRACWRSAWCGAVRRCKVPHTLLPPTSATIRALP